MNELIKELAEQASHQSPDGYPVTIPYSKDFVEKFAQLIVRECASLFPQTFTDEQYQRRIDKTIKKHFGVER
jgi:hypothetical protein